MGERKIIFTKDWLNADPKISEKAKRVHRFQQIRVTRSEDLPELMTTNEAAKFLARHYKTVEEYRKEGSLKFFKIRGRYFTTPEYIAEFIEKESAKK